MWMGWEEKGPGLSIDLEGGGEGIILLPGSVGFINIPLGRRPFRSILSIRRWPVGQSSIIGHMETNEGDTGSNIGKSGTILSGKRDRKLKIRILVSFGSFTGKPY